MSTTYPTALGILTNTAAVKEHGFRSEVRALREEFNKLAEIVACQMPGALLSDPAVKTGTTAAEEWRNEAFTFTFRGKVTAGAATETAFTDATHDTAATKESWYVLSVQADGTTFIITKGADQVIGTKVLPTIPDNEVVVGYLQMITGVTGFDATTDELVADGTLIASLAFYDMPHIKSINLS